MTETVTVSRPERLEIVDALRGLALLGIILVHNVDHFDIGWVAPAARQGTLLSSLDNLVSNIVFTLFGGKAYAMFALLFGFSFFIQFRNADRKKIRFAGRFVWRMVLLLGFGFFHVIFYSGEILSCYAVAGVLLLPLRNLSTRALLILAAVFMLEPWEAGRIIYAAFDPQWQPVAHDYGYYAQAMEAATEQGSFWVMARTNLTAGMLNSHIFAWLSGRYFQTISLFILGLLIGRHSIFADSPLSRKLWKRVLAVSAISIVPLFLLKISIPAGGIKPGFIAPLEVISTMWSNLSIMALLVSAFVLLWFDFARVRRFFCGLIPFGRMSLTNYITSSIIGSFIYYRWGLGLFPVLGPTYSLLIGTGVFLGLQLFSRRWLLRHRKGPLENLWGRLTWIGSGR